MAYVRESFNFGKMEVSEELEAILNSIDIMYRDLAHAINMKPDFVFRTSSPTTADKDYTNNTGWLVVGTPNELWILFEVDSSGNAIWEQIF